MMMTDAAAADLPAVEQGLDPAATPRWPALWADLRFFLLCYVAGLIAFLVMLS